MAAFMAFPLSFSRYSRDWRTTGRVPSTLPFSVEAPGMWDMPTRGACDRALPAARGEAPPAPAAGCSPLPQTIRKGSLVSSSARRCASASARRRASACARASSARSSACRASSAALAAATRACSSRSSASASASCAIRCAFTSAALSAAPARHCASRSAAALAASRADTPTERVGAILFAAAFSAASLRSCALAIFSATAELPPGRLAAWRECSAVAPPSGPPARGARCGFIPVRALEARGISDNSKTPFLRDT
jgi:hypothetical protein